MYSTHDRTVKEPSDEQPSNTDSGSSVTPPMPVTSRRDEHPMKAPYSSSMTASGMWMDMSDEQSSKALTPMDVTRYSEPSRETVSGMWTDTGSPVYPTTDAVPSSDVS